MIFVFFFFKQKTAYEMRISDWSSDVCSSDLADDLETLDSVGRGLHPSQQGERVDRARAPRPADRARGDRGREPKRGGSDDPQRSLGADQQLGQVVTAIVLLEHGKPVIDRAVGQIGRAHV